MDPSAPSKVRRVSTVRSRFGLQPNAPLDEEHQDLDHHELLWSRIRLAMREPFAEFFGTFIMVLFGDGSVAQVPFDAPVHDSNRSILAVHRCCFLLDWKPRPVGMDSASINRFPGGKLQ